MKKIKMMLALLAALVCGGAWAATPVAVWNGDLADNSTKNGYTMSNGGNASFSNGQATLARQENVGAINKGLVVGWDAVPLKTYTVEFTYSGYSESGGRHPIVSFLNANDATTTIYAPYNKANVDVTFNVTSSSPDPTAVAATSGQIPAAGTIRVTICPGNKRIILETKATDAQTFTLFKEWTAADDTLWPMEGVKGVQIGGTHGPSNRYYRPALTITDVKIYADMVTLEAEDVAYVGMASGETAQELSALTWTTAAGEAAEYSSIQDSDKIRIEGTGKFTLPTARAGKVIIGANAIGVLPSSGTVTVSTPISGAGSLEKTGSETLTLTLSDTKVAGGIKVSQGTLATGAKEVLKENVIVVENGATFNIAQDNDTSNRGYVVVLNGGSVVSAGVGNAHGHLINQLILTADGTMANTTSGSGFIGIGSFIGDGHGHNTQNSFLSLNGHTLTITGRANDTRVYFDKTTITSAGTINVTKGRMFIHCAAINAPTGTKLIIGENAALIGDTYGITVDDLVYNSNTSLNADKITATVNKNFYPGSGKIQKVTIGPNCVLHLAENAAENTAITLCSDTLSATSAENVIAYIGDTPKRVNLTYDTSAKTVTYAVVDKARLYWSSGNWNADTNYKLTANGSADTKYIDGYTITFNENATVYQGKNWHQAVDVEVAADVILTLGHDDFNAYNGRNIESESTIGLASGAKALFSYWGGANNNYGYAELEDLTINGANGSWGIADAKVTALQVTGAVTGTAPLKIENGQTVEIKNGGSIATPIVIAAGGVLKAEDGGQIRGAVTGEGTIELSCTGATKDISNWFAANTLGSFTGWVKIAGGRVKASAALEPAVKIKVVDGGQFWVNGGSWANAFEVSGNGWAGEGNEIARAAIRLDGNAEGTSVSISGAITVVVENDVVPTIGTYNSTAAAISGAISCANGLKVLASQESAVLTVTGAINGGAGETSPVVEKIGAGKVVFGTGATATNVALKLSAGNIEKTASMAFISATTDVTGKLVFSSNTEYKLITGTLMANTTELWGADDNSTYLSRSADSPTALFASDISLAKIASGEYKFTGKMKGAWIATARDVKVVKRDDYVDGSNKLELQCQMYDGEHTNDKNDWYTKCQNLTLMQIEVNGVYYLFAQAYKGFYVDDHIDHCGDVITTSTTNYHTVNSENAYEAIKLELVIGDIVAKIGNRTFMTLEAAIEAANAMQGDAEIVMQGLAESPLESTDSVTLKSNVILKMTPYAKTIGTISGSGVVVFDGFLPGNAQRNVFVTDAWTGTVVIEHVTANTTYGNFGTCCNANSSLALDGVSCYFYTNGTAAYPDVVCKNLTIGEQGITLKGTFSTACSKYTFEKILGSGTITVEMNVSTGADKYGFFCLIGDISEFTGKIAFSGERTHEVVFAISAEDIPPSNVENYTSGTVYYASGAARPDIIADGTTLTVAPGGDLTVPADFNVANVTVKYAGAVLNNESGPIAVAIVDNKLVYSIKPEMENTVRPTVTTMAAPTEGEGEDATDKVQFTITNPIPGLFYSIVSADNPAEFDKQNGEVEDSVGTQATNDESTTTAIDMPIDAKVKFFRVRVKATK